MSSIAINQLTFAGFLVLTFVVGLYARSGQKTMRDYVLASQTLGGGMLWMSLIATLVEAGDLNIKVPYLRGLIGLLDPIALAMMAFLLGWFVFPKLTAFEGHHTLGDIMHTLYGPFARLFCVLAGSALSYFLIVGQFVAMGELSGLLGISPPKLIAVVGLFVTLYTCIGGIRAVTVTDVLQFIIIAGGFSLAFFAVIKQQGGILSILSKVGSSSDRLGFWHHPNLGKRFFATFFWSIWPTLLLAPPVIQRVLMTKQKQQIRHMFLGYSLFLPIFHSLLLLVGLSLFLASKKTAIGADTDLAQTIQILCPNQALIHTIFLLAVCAVLMSTVASFLHTLAVLWANDVIGPLVIARRQPMDMVLLSRTLCLCCGGVCTLSALLIPATFFDLAGYASLCVAPISVPFIAGIAGLKGSKRIFTASIAAYFVSFLSALFLARAGYLEALVDRLIDHTALFHSTTTFEALWVPWLIAITVSTLTFFVAHYLENGGFLLVDRETGKWMVQRSYPLFLPYLDWLVNPVGWANNKVAKYGREAYLLAIFLYCSFLVPYATLDSTAPTLYLVSILRSVGVLFCTLLLLESIWPKAFLPYFNLLYFLTIFHCIPFSNTLISLYDSSALFSVVNIVLGMILLTVLVDWKTFLGMELVGTALALLLRKMCSGAAIPHFGLYGGWLLAFSVAYTLLVCLVFARKKQLLSATTQARLQADKKSHTSFLDDYLSLHQQLTVASHAKSSMMQTIQDAVAQLQGSGADQRQLQRIVYATKHLQQVANKSYEHLPLKAKKIALADLLNEVYSSLQAYGIEPSEQVALAQTSQLQTLVCDPTYMVELLTNGIKYMVEHHPGRKLLFAIEDAHLSYQLLGEEKPTRQPAIRFCITDQASTPPARESYTLDHQSGGELPAEDLLLVRNQQIVRAHYGLAYLRGEERIATQEYILPASVELLRPKIASFSEEDLRRETVVDSAAEQRFLERANERGGFSREDLGQLMAAMKVAKYYHRHQYRQSGEPYYVHPLAVADIALDYTQDRATLLAALLHDTVEDTAYTLAQMAAMFGEEVATIVSLVSQLYNAELRKVKVPEHISHAEMFARADQRAYLIKLADRLHNMRTIASMPLDKQVAKALDTRDNFLPLGRQMKLTALASELETLVNRVLNKVRV